MILKKIKSSESGAALIICLVIVLFLSLLGTMNFNATRAELKISGNINAKNIKFQAAEISLDVTIDKNFNESTLANTLQMQPGVVDMYCISGISLYQGKDCKGKYLNSDKSVISTSSIELNDTSECLAYGSSDQKAQCFVIRGEGQIPQLTSEKESHIQELQINTANMGNNGVYEL